MEELRLQGLLPFLNGKSNWTLSCRNGKYSLSFGRRKKFKFKGVPPKGRGGAAAAAAAAKIARKMRDNDDFMRAKWLREIGAQRSTEGGGGALQDSMCGGDDEGDEEGEGEETDEDTLNEGDSAAAGDGGLRSATGASCDSLFWDDYGVKPQVENPSLEQELQGTS